MRTIGRLLLIGAVLAVSACAPASRFEWGTYENTLYAYSKTPEAKEAYRNSLIAALRNGEASNRVAPGLNAELGYLYMEEGRTAEAIQYFEAEKRLFPESQRFMDGVITRLRSVEAVGTSR
ncbi:DUF4810 domain-containing protein [Brevundimonas sp.]|uniref:DUF4810 domain-containing protein n=1 Tax=Brevundimonas sp. TaxID=1871086 RepID=UPI00351D8844